MRKNAWIYEARFFKPTTGSRNLAVEDNVHSDTGCLIDLSDEVFIGANAALSPRVVVLTHADQASIISEQRTAQVVTGGSS